MGYIVVLVVGGIALVVLAILLLAKPPTRPGGQVGAPVGPDRPAADEPTPDRSVTSSRQRIDTAREHTPPA